MSKHNNLKLISSFKFISFIMSVIVCLIGVVVLYGWIADVMMFKSILPYYTPMKPKSAMAFILIGISLYLQRPSLSANQVANTVGKILGFVIAFFGSITLLETLAGQTFYSINQLFIFNHSMRDTLLNNSSPSPAAVINFIFIGISLMLLNINQRLLLIMNQVLQCAIGLMGLLILTGYIFSFHSGIMMETATHSSLYTALGFILISLSLLFMRPAQGAMSLFVSNTHGGTVARRLTPIVIIVPILLGYVGILGDHYKLYDARTGVEFYSVCITTTLILVTVFISDMLMRADKNRFRIEKKLRLSEERFHNAMETAPIGMAIVSLEGQYLEVNQALCQLFGYDKDELANMSFKQVTHPADLDIDMVNSQKLIEGKIPLNQIEKRYIRKNGEIIWVQLTASIFRDSATDKPLYFISQVEDITDRKLTEEKIRHLAYHDSLTNLPNRRLLLDRLNHAIEFANRHQNMMALMFMDLDKFKMVNDTLGHDIGDELLKAVAARLNSILRSIDTIARVSGDEFVIVLNELSASNEAAIIASKIIESINDRFLVHGHEINIGCSIGIALYPTDGCKVDDLMKKADLAMYMAKQSGRNQYRYHTSDSAEACLQSS